MNFADVMDTVSNQVLTENGANAYKSTLNPVLDLFALGASYRTRSDADCIGLFKKALEADETLAIKCLFYIGDVRCGQGERRFFKVCTRWLANEYPNIIGRNLKMIPEYTRWDNLYTFVGTPLESDALIFIARQLKEDMNSETPSLCAKWAKSANTTSKESRALGELTRRYLSLTQKDYRKMLSTLRGRINVLEKLMSAGEWDKIDFSKIPSKAGFNYRKAFINREETSERYKAFAADKSAKINAGTLYPYEVVEKAIALPLSTSLEDPERLMLNKYWENLTDTIKEFPLDGICVCDTSGSMMGIPMFAAIALSMLCAERCSGPYHNKFITFNQRPHFVKIEGVDFVDKVDKIYHTEWGYNTNLEAVFDLILSLAKQYHLSPYQLPKKLFILSDMNFDAACKCNETVQYQSLLESIESKWASEGYIMPKLVFWNLNAFNDIIPMQDNGRVTFCSGFSQNLFETIIQDKTAWDLVLSTLLSERYAAIT